MALSQSALSELLEVFRAGEGVDLIRESVRMVMQDLIESKPPSRSAPAATSAPRPAPPTATAPVRGCHDPGRRRRVCGSRSCARGRSSRSSWSRAAGSTRPCMRW